ncbi:DUF3139 domain-containing protein [Bacillus sp. JJ722]|uniref:DUF3139 domain-containing protein n=1 Tax=Bacillus sp. JJ722 TaxID=3122973 RepID=UPI00300054CA
MKKTLMYSLIVIITVGVTSGVIFYYLNFPYQKKQAEQALEYYIEKQGISKENIKSKKIMKDYKQGGYTIDITFRDDPEVNYQYVYGNAHNNKPFSISLAGYDKNNSSIDAEDLLHKPLIFK